MNVFFSKTCKTLDETIWCYEDMPPKILDVVLGITKTYRSMHTRVRVDRDTYSSVKPVVIPVSSRNRSVGETRQTAREIPSRANSIAVLDKICPPRPIKMLHRETIPSPVLNKLMVSVDVNHHVTYLL